MVAKLKCYSLENIRSWTVVLYGQSLLLHRLFNWKSFVVTDQSMKTTKLFHPKQFVIYNIKNRFYIYKKFIQQDNHYFLKNRF